MSSEEANKKNGKGKKVGRERKERSGESVTLSDLPVLLHRFSFLCLTLKALYRSF